MAFTLTLWVYNKLSALATAFTTFILWHSEAPYCFSEPEMCCQSDKLVACQVEINVPSLPSIRDFDRIHCTIGWSTSKATMVDSMVRCSLPPPNRLPPTPPHQGTARMTCSVKLQSLEYNSKDILKNTFGLYMKTVWCIKSYRIL